MAHGYKITQYSCAVLLIVSSIALAWVTAIDNDDIANGVLLYIAQAFLLAGSIFGLEYYVHLISSKVNYDYKEKRDNPAGNPKQ